MHRSRVLPAAVATAALLALSSGLSGCAPALGVGDWKLEPISWDAQTFGDVDVAFGMSTVAADGVGGFWSGSAGSWLRVGADGETLARFNIEVEHPLHGIGDVAALSPTELVAVRSRNEPDATPGLSLVDMETLEYTDVPMKPLPEDEPDPAGFDFGDFMFGALAVHDGDAYVIRYQPTPPTPAIDSEVLRIDLDTGEREVVHREALTFDESTPSAPGAPPVDIDVDAEGRIYLATPANRIVLAPDGTELSRTAQSATRPVVAVRPDGLALWWGGSAEPSTAESVIVGGSAEARDLIKARQSCDELYRQDALHLTYADEQEPLSLLCSPNAAAWVGDAWVVAVGGEGDGVLVRLTPPAHLPPGGPTVSSTT
ncbi:hypothetical protein ACTU6U_07265 [Microbacterium sp. A196]|uniref:hypothetical protein n=1 Tax=Microbacterium sp. A196 TaxID=3457320 RepID=UPI003FD4F988